MGVASCKGCRSWDAGSALPCSALYLPACLLACLPVRLPLASPTGPPSPPTHTHQHHLPPHPHPHPPPHTHTHTQVPTDYFSLWGHRTHTYQYSVTEYYHQFKGGEQQPPAVYIL